MATLWFRLVVEIILDIPVPPLAPTICWSHAPFPSWNLGVIEAFLVAFPSTTGWFQWDLWPWEYDLPNFLRYAAWYLSSDLGPLVACTISSWSFSITRDYSQTTWNAMNQLHTAQLAVRTRWMIPVSCWCLASCFFSSHFWLHRKVWWRSSGDPYKSMAIVPSTRSPGAYSATSCRNEVPKLGSCGWT